MAKKKRSHIRGPPLTKGSRKASVNGSLRFSGTPKLVKDFLGRCAEPVSVYGSVPSRDVLVEAD